MKAYAPRAALLALVLAMLTPRAAHAQESDTCEQYYCDAFAEYSYGSFAGYVAYWDNDLGWFMGIDGYVSGPSGGVEGASCFSYPDYDYATTTCNYSPDVNGIWEIAGDPWYQVESWREPDGGFVSYDVGVTQQPSGEDKMWDGQVIAGDKFFVTLQPTYFDFDTFQTAENVGPADDQCFAQYHKTQQPAQTSSAPPGNTTNNSYYDTVDSPDSYVKAYEAAVNQANSSCGWSAFQQMFYGGASSPYTSRYLTQTISPGNQLTTCRDVCDTFTY